MSTELGQALDFNGLSHAIAAIRDEFTTAAIAASRPSVLYRPSVMTDGDKWVALYGANLQEGVAGFGDTPSEAMADFDKNWYGQKLKPRPESK